MKTMTKKKTELMIELPILSCLRCGYNWVPRINRLPEVCPKCKSRIWNKKRQEVVITEEDLK